MVGVTPRQSQGHVLSTSHRYRKPSRPHLTGIGEVAAIAVADLVMVGGWTTWWHLGVFSSDDSIGAILGRTMDFLSWTFLPCWAVALAIVVGCIPLLRRMRPESPPLMRCLLTLIAPPLWALMYCLYYDDVGYTPTAMLVAEGAWIVTLQPLWAYIGFLRLSRGMETDRGDDRSVGKSFSEDLG